MGYSSLRYLRMLPISGLKIDRSFVSGIGAGLASEPIVQMVLDLARSLDLHVVAEGIETPEQAERLRALGCATGQGYIFSRPLLPGSDQPLALPADLLAART
jgi:EAL domain-containing protein (putative c-di-GMP-specific phosphodiesterase class I)